MTSMDFLMWGISAFGGSFFYAIVFNSGKIDALWGSALGIAGWFLYIIIADRTGSLPLGNFIGAFCVGVFAEVFAGIFKKPATVFAVSGLWPLLPGKDMYQTMRAAVESNMPLLASTGLQTLAISASIALGVAIASSSARIVRTIMRRFGFWWKVRLVKAQTEKNNR